MAPPCEPIAKQALSQLSYGPKNTKYTRSGRRSAGEQPYVSMT
jgi:hypothetical protein